MPELIWFKRISDIKVAKDDNLDTDDQDMPMIVEGHWLAAELVDNSYQLRLISKDEILKEPPMLFYDREGDSDNIRVVATSEDVDAPEWQKRKKEGVSFLILGAFATVFGVVAACFLSGAKDTEEKLTWGSFTCILGIAAICLFIFGGARVDAYSDIDLGEDKGYEGLVFTSNRITEAKLEAFDGTKFDFNQEEPNEHAVLVRSSD